jgi:hypothetical protein
VALANASEQRNNVPEPSSQLALCSGIALLAALHARRARRARRERAARA